MEGGYDNDIYFVDNVGDQVIETADIVEHGQLLRGGIEVRVFGIDYYHGGLYRERPRADRLGQDHRQ